MDNCFIKIANKAKLRVAGLMSGTSGDGVDVAVADIDEGGVKLCAFDTSFYPASLRKKVFEAFSPDSARLDEICRLNFILGEFFAEALIKVCEKTGISMNSIDLIGSHGQTIYHDPEGVRYKKLVIRSTMQIGEPAVIAFRTGKTTIADFRVKDVAAGGQGAPLVPYADYCLFRNKNTSRAIQNIGGIANVTYLPARCSFEDIIAFDTGPGNMVIDRIVELITDGKKKYDKGGRIAAKGVVNERLLKQLLRHRFFSCVPPKTTGREDYGIQYSDKLYKQALKNNISPADLVATVTALTAHSIADAYKKFLPRKPDEIVLCGGGAHNQTLVGMLKNCLADIKIVPMEDFGISVDAKEALSFAILAYAFVKNIPNNVPSATGASKPVILGKMVPAL